MNTKKDKARVAFTIKSLSDKREKYNKLKDNLINLLGTCESFPPLLKSHGDERSLFAKAYQTSQFIIKRQVANYEETIDLIDEFLSTFESIKDDKSVESFIDICNYSLWAYSLVTYDGFGLAEANKKGQTHTSNTL
jgi:hypothetical protein